MYRWMDYYADKHNIKVHHKMNSGKEKRDAAYLADGWAEPTQFLAPDAISHDPHDTHGYYPDEPPPRGSPKGLILQFDGCYFHGHECYLTSHVKDRKLLKERAKNTEKRNEYYLAEGYDLVVERECRFLTRMRHDPVLQERVDNGRPEFYQSHKGPVTKDQLLQAVRDDKLFGALEVDVSIPETWSDEFKHRTMSPKEYFGEMSPLFVTASVEFDSIGPHMQNHVREHGLSTKPRKLLVGGLRAKKMKKTNYRKAR